MKQLSIFFSCLFFFTALQAQPEKFSRPAHFTDLHTVYTYQKSNWDGSHASTIFLYVADSAQLQSFKWNRGDERATLVTADFDWNTFAVRKFQTRVIFADGTRKLKAELTVTKPRNVVLQLGPFNDTMTLDSDLWHSYDFDFASLGFGWRALKNKKEGFSFRVADFAMVNRQPAFVNKGLVQVDFLSEENRGGKKLLHYKIDGPGLENRGGQIWINAATNMIEEYRIALPDEEGFENGMLILQKEEKFSPAEWQKFIAAKMQEK